jgi:hypothetical protein
MQYTGPPTNGTDLTLYVFGEHYGFADFDYPTTTGVLTQTYLVLGKDTYILMPIRASFCFAAAVIIALFLILAAIVFSKRRRSA